MAESKMPVVRTESGQVQKPTRNPHIFDKEVGMTFAECKAVWTGKKESGPAPDGSNAS